MMTRPESRVWVYKTIRDLATINYGKSPKEVLSADGLYPVVGTGGTERYGNAFLYDGESIILGRKGTIDRVHFVTGRFWTIDTAYFLSDFGNTQPRWLFYFLQNLDLRQLNEATGVPSLSRDLLYKIVVETPPKPEQTKIAEILSTVDQAIDQTEALIAKQHRIKTGLMQDLLMRGIDENGNLRSEDTHEFKDSPLGRIPVEWELFTIDALGDVVTGSTPSTAVESFYDGDIMFISPKDVSNIAEFIKNTEKTLTKQGLAMCRVIPPYSICTVCIGSTIGKIGLTTTRCATNQQINTLIPAISEDAEMLLFAMRLFLKGQLRKEAGLQAVPIVNKSLFSKMTLPFPVDSEEKARGRVVLNVVSSQITAQITHLGKLRSLKIALMQDLLTGEMSVTPLLTETEVGA